MTPYKRGDVVLVPFPFTDFSSLKQRPALVISSDEFNASNTDLIAVAITSHVSTYESEPYTHSIKGTVQKSAGLPKESIIRSGKIVIRSDNVEGKIADQVRTQLAVIAIPAGYLRKSSKYTVSPDGLGLHYDIVDHEVFKKPPVPAYKSSGSYKEQTQKAGAVRYVTASVTLDASKFVDQRFTGVFNSCTQKKSTSSTQSAHGGAALV